MYKNVHDIALMFKHCWHLISHVNWFCSRITVAFNLQVSNFDASFKSFDGWELRELTLSPFVRIKGGSYERDHEEEEEIESNEAKNEANGNTGLATFSFSLVFPLLYQEGVRKEGAKGHLEYLD